MICNQSSDYWKPLLCLLRMCNICVVLLQLEAVPGGHGRFVVNTRYLLVLYNLFFPPQHDLGCRLASCPIVPDVLLCVCHSFDHPHCSLDPAAALVSSFLVPDQFPSLLLYLLVYSVPVTCWAKIYFFPSPVGFLPAPRTCPGVCLWVCLPLDLGWLAMLSKVSFGAFLISLLPDENTCSLSPLV